MTARKPLSEETKEKIRVKSTGRKHSQETKDKISKAKKGNSLVPSSAFKRGAIPWNKGKKWSQEIKDKFSKSHTGKHLSEDHKLSIGKSSIGHTLSYEARKKIGDAHRDDKNWNWKDIDEERDNYKMRESSEYKIWRKNVFERDNYTCQWCGQVGGDLEADHIRPWASHEEYRFILWNGRTLCKECHKKTREYGGRMRRSLSPFISMIIPCYTKSKELEKMAIDCVASYRNQVDEMIILEDGQLFSETLANMADIYIYNKKNKGFTASVNEGWRMATGEFVCIVNSDTTLLPGCNLKDLCIPGKISSPLIVNQYIDRLAGPFWCAPREVTKKYGYLMEEMLMYSSDSEYDERVKDIFQKVPSVKIYHEMAQSVTAAGVEGGVTQERDRQIYAQLQKEGKAK